MRRRVFLATAVALGLSATPAAAAETAWLDTFSTKADTSKYIGPVATKTRLTKGKPYVASVRGTWGFYDTSRHQLCGSPERRPMYRTRVRGVTNRRAVADAEFYFAQQQRHCGDPARIVTPGVKFQLTTGRVFTDPVPLGPALTAPTRNHKYSYALRGAGRKARFRIPDTAKLDNYGRLRITVRAATEADCTTFTAGAFGFADLPACVAATQLPETKPFRRRMIRTRAR